MSGFYRGTQALRPLRIREAVADILNLEAVTAQVTREADPFHCDDPCPLNPAGPHRPIATCGEVVCWHCAKIFWG